MTVKNSPSLKVKGAVTYDINVTLSLKSDGDQYQVKMVLSKDERSNWKKNYYIYMFDLSGKRNEVWDAIRSTDTTPPELVPGPDAPQNIRYYLHTSPANLFKNVPIRNHFRAFNAGPAETVLDFNDPGLPGQFKITLYLYFGSKKLVGEFDPLELVVILPSKSELAAAQAAKPTMEEPAKVPEKPVQVIRTEPEIKVPETNIPTTVEQKAESKQSTQPIVKQESKPSKKPEKKSEAKLVSCAEIKRKLESKLTIIDNDYFSGDYSPLADSLMKGTVDLEKLTVHVNKLDFARKDEFYKRARASSELASTALNKLEKYRISLNEINSEIQKRDDCKSELKEISESLKKLLGNISTNKESFEKINDILNSVLGVLVTGREEKITLLRQEFENQFRDLMDQYRHYDSLTIFLTEDFDRKTEKNNYYTWKKKKHLESVMLNRNSLTLLNAKYDSLNQSLNSKARKLLDSPARTANIANDLIDSIALSKNELLQQNNNLLAEIENYPADSFPFLYIFIVLSSVLIMGFGGWVYYKALRKRKKLAGQPNSVDSGRKSSATVFTVTGEENESSEAAPTERKVGGITITPKRVEGSGASFANKGRGLGHVYREAGVQYYEIDLGDIWNDTMVRKVFIHRSCIRKTYKFFYESCQTKEGGKVLETGGYLIGGWDYSTVESGKFDVSLEEFIEPGDDAVYGEYQLNFGAKISVRLDRITQDIKEKTGRDMMLMAWFHSHPQIKIFLSNHDLDVQERITSEENKKKLLALVIDPNTQENGKINFSTGFFSYKSTGVMNNNDGTMKFISWKNLYDWANSPVMPNLSDQYCLEMSKSFSDSILNQVYFSDKCIIRLSLFLDENMHNPDSFAYFTGQVYDDQLNNRKIGVLDDLVDTPQQSGNSEHLIIGYLSCSQETDMIINKVASDPEAVKYEILLFCTNVKKDLKVFTRKSDLQFNMLADSNSVIHFSELEAWPTRKR